MMPLILPDTILLQPPRDNLEDQNERSSPLGYYNVADSYWAAASFILDQNLDTTHHDNATRFLFYHSIECFLKAYLRCKGLSIQELAHPKKFGHKVNKLASKAKSFRLNFDDEDLEVICLMSNSDTVIRARYFLRGPFDWPHLDSLNRTCRSLAESVGMALKGEGIPVRYRDRLIQFER